MKQFFSTYGSRNNICYVKAKKMINDLRFSKNFHREYSHENITEIIVYLNKIIYINFNISSTQKLYLYYKHLGRGIITNKSIGPNGIKVEFKLFILNNILCFSFFFYKFQF